MTTHVVKTNGPAGLFDAPLTGRVLAIYGVSFDGEHAVARNPSCSWCARKLDEAITTQQQRSQAAQ